MLESIFCLEAFIIAFAVSGLLMLANKLFPSLQTYKWFKKLQPLFPFILASIGSIVYPPEFASTIAQMLIWSIIPGMMAGSGYKIFKAMLFEKTGVDIDSEKEVTKKDKKKIPEDDK